MMSTIKELLKEGWKTYVKYCEVVNQLYMS